jgi:hypothetical protein
MGALDVRCFNEIHTIRYLNYLLNISHDFIYIIGSRRNSIFGINSFQTIPLFPNQNPWKPTLWRPRWRPPCLETTSLPAQYTILDPNIQIERELLQRALSFCEVKGHFRPHSFRIGAATEAKRFGIHDDVIKKWGRWTSDAYTKYIRFTISVFGIKACIRRMSHIMFSASCQPLTVPRSFDPSCITTKNLLVRNQVISIGGCAIRHCNLRAREVNLYRSDGTHLSNSGTEI